MSDFAIMTMSQINELMKETMVESYPQLVELLCDDERAGVKKIVLKLNKDYNDYLTELKRIENLKRIEEQFYEAGYELIAGTDEVGRGPLCGPVVSAVVVMPRDSAILYINDSKKLTPKMRDRLYDQIMENAISVGIGIVDHTEIDRINILNASKLSMKIAFEQLSVKPDILLLDAVSIDVPVPQKSYIKGDENVYCIAAASIVAKVTRDRIMQDYAVLYPQYHLESNKGYGSAEHVEAIRKYGPCVIHRRSFLNSIELPKSKTVGISYEKIACEYLTAQGFQIAAQNYKRGGGEIDIVFTDGDSYVFCEVKARSNSSFGLPEEFVDKAKQRRIVQTAQIFMAEKVIFETGRFDVIAIDIEANGKYTIRHIKDAFQLS